MSRSNQLHLTDHEKHVLLRLSRDTLIMYLSTKKRPQSGAQSTPAIMSSAGVFVTLEKSGDLRGCIGCITSTDSIETNVINYSIAAAIQDPRFEPVTKDELAELSISISVLTPPEPVDGFRDIVVGTHGVILSKHGRKAVFLPKVATEHGWDLDTMLSHLAVKAGLSSTEWRSGTSFSVFKAIEFSEETV